MKSQWLVACRLGGGDGNAVFGFPTKQAASAFARDCRRDGVQTMVAKTRKPAGKKKGK
jgi:hypothetical protein